MVNSITISSLRLNLINFCDDCLADGLCRQKICVLLVWRFHKASLPPEVRCKEAICLQQTLKGCLDKVSKSLGRPTRRCENIVNTNKLQHFLWNPSRHNFGTTWGRNHPHGGTATLTGHLTRHGVWPPDLVTPVTPSHRNHRQLRQYDSATDGSGNLFGALNAKTHVAVRVTDDDEGLKPRPSICGR
ncbi:hypothetical protein WN943_003412 [Citrus x changshan-huyou]